MLRLLKVGVKVVVRYFVDIDLVIVTMIDYLQS